MGTHAIYGAVSSLPNESRKAHNAPADRDSSSITSHNLSCDRHAPPTLIKRTMQLNPWLSLAMLGGPPDL